MGSGHGRRTGVVALIMLAAVARGTKADEAQGGAAAGVIVGADGLVVQSESGDYELRIAPLVQADARFYTAESDEPGVDSFLLRSVRPIVLGTVARRFDFAIVPDFGQGQSTVQDAYVEARFSPKARFRVGKFKTPFGLERLQAESNLLFAERALPSDIAPNRDVGLQLQGEVAHGVLLYAVALLDGAVDGSSLDQAASDAKEGAVRAFVRPFKNAGGPLQGLGLGLAATFGRSQGPLPVYRTPGQLAFFSYVGGAVADGRRTRLSPQAHFYGGPLGVLFEHVRSTQRVRKDERAHDVTNDAWQLAASWLLTGEKATSGRIEPRRAFDPGTGGWGALELAARVHALAVDERAFALGLADPARSARRALAWGMALTWHLNRNLKYVANFERTSFEGGRAGGDRGSEGVFFFRAQLAF